jgi:hypothetical protein
MSLLVAPLIEEKRKKEIFFVGSAEEPGFAGGKTLPPRFLRDPSAARSVPKLPVYSAQRT